MNYKINIKVLSNIKKVMERINSAIKNVNPIKIDMPKIPSIENMKSNIKYSTVMPKTPNINPLSANANYKNVIPKAPNLNPLSANVNYKNIPPKAPSIKPITSNVNYKVKEPKAPTVKPIETKVKYKNDLPKTPTVKPLETNVKYKNIPPKTPTVKPLKSKINYKNDLPKIPKVKPLESKIKYENVVEKPIVNDIRAKVVFSNVISKMERIRDSVANIRVVKTIKENVQRTYNKAPIPKIKEQVVKGTITYRNKLNAIRKNLGLKAKIVYSNVIKKPILKPLSSIINYKNNIIKPKLSELQQQIKMKYQGFKNFSLSTKEQLIKVRVAGIESAKKKISSLKEIAISAGGALTSIALPVLSSVKFEKDFVAVKKLFKGTKEELKQFRLDLMGMSMEMPSSVSDLSIMASAGLQSGVDTAIIKDYTALVAKASTAFDMMPEPVGEAFAKIRTQMGYGIEDLTKYADVVNYVADSTASSAKDILNVTQRIAGSAGSINLKIPEVVALASASIQLTGSPEVAGSATVSIINSLKSNVKGAIDGLEKDGLQYYISYLEKLKKLDKQAQFTKVKDVFGAGESAELVRKSIKQISALKLTLDVANAKESLGSLQREFDNVTSTVSARWDIMKNRINIAMIRIGDIILPIVSKILNYISGLLKGFADWVSKNKEIVASVLKVIAVVSALMVGIIAFKLTMALLSYAFSGVIVQIGIIIASLGTLILPIVAVGSVIYGLIKYWDEFVLSMKSAIGVENLAVISSVFDAIGNSISWVVDKVKIFFGSFGSADTGGISFIQTIFEGLGSTIGFVIGGIITGWNWLTESISNVIPTDTIDNVMQGFNSLYNVIMMVVTPITNTVSWAYNKIAEFFDFEPFVNSGDILSIIGNVIKSVIEGIGWVIGNIINIIALGFKGIAWVIENIATLINSVSIGLIEIVTGIYNFFTELTIPSSIMDTVNAIWENFKAFGSWLSTIFSDMFSSAFSPIMGFIDSMLAKLNNVKKAIASALESLPSIKMPDLKISQKVDSGISAIKGFFGMEDDKKKEKIEPIKRDSSDINIVVSTDSKSKATVKANKLQGVRVTAKPFG